jgi:hypothetical protein
MTETEAQKLRESGIDDATIQSIASEEAQKGGQAQTGTPGEPALPEIDVTQQSDTLRNAQAAGIPTTNEGSWAADAAAVGSAVAPYAIPTVATGAGLYGAAKVGGWGRNVVNKVGEGINAMNTQSLVGQHAAEGVADRELVRQGAMSAQEAMNRQVAREAAMNAQRGPAQAAQAARAAGPVNPMAAEQGLANRVKQTAAQRITGLMPSMGEALGSAGRMAGRVVGGVGPALMAYSGDTGPQVPQVGRMRGSEINPMSGKPWTPTEIRAYSANPSMYDQAYLQRPQLPR